MGRPLSGQRATHRRGPACQTSPRPSLTLVLFCFILSCFTSFAFGPAGQISRGPLAIDRSLRMGRKLAGHRAKYRAGHRAKPRGPSSHSSSRASVPNLARAFGLSTRTFVLFCFILSCFIFIRSSVWYYRSLGPSGRYSFSSCVPSNPPLAPPPQADSSDTAPSMPELASTSGSESGSGEDDTAVFRFAKLELQWEKKASRNVHATPYIASSGRPFSTAIARVTSLVTALPPTVA
jgi:hypothetical protein